MEIKNIIIGLIVIGIVGTIVWFYSIPLAIELEKGSSDEAELNCKNACLYFGGRFKDYSVSSLFVCRCIIENRLEKIGCEDTNNPNSCYIYGGWR